MVSLEVCTVMASEPAVTAPIVTPVIVTTNAAAGMAAPAAVMMTEEAPVVPHVPDKPTTLLLPAATVGVMEAAKNVDG